jgi:hypothetical protein
MPVLFKIANSRSFSKLQTTCHQKLIMALKIKGFSSVFGGFLIHLTLGTFYTIGNMNTYITSYLKKHGENGLTYSSAIWINTGFITGMGKYSNFNYKLNYK